MAEGQKDRRGEGEIEKGLKDRRKRTRLTRTEVK